MPWIHSSRHRKPLCHEDTAKGKVYPLQGLCVPWGLYLFVFICIYVYLASATYHSDFGIPAESRDCEAVSQINPPTHLGMGPPRKCHLRINLKWNQFIDLWLVTCDLLSVTCSAWSDRAPRVCCLHIYLDQIDCCMIEPRPFTVLIIIFINFTLKVYPAPVFIILTQLSLIFMQF